MFSTTVLSWLRLIDHFSFANEDTYLQRYLINDTYWKPNCGPIFFYTGNEGDIEWFCNNTVRNGFMWDIASEFNALLIFAEHRYYGKSLPYGNSSFSTPKHLGYLTSEQALADFAELLTFFKKSTKGAANVPVIAFGGSYGGMLAAWMRIKYPHIIQGSIAASAPILQFTNLTDCHVYNSLVTRDFSSVSSECSKSIRKSWDIINNFNETDSGREFLTQTFHLCSPIKTNDDLLNLKNWLGETYSSLAMMNYPYPTDFMATLPGWPEVCKHLLNSSIDKEALLKSLFAGVSVYFNYTGQSKCLNTTDMGSKDLGNDGWDYQACTEMVMPMCADGINDMYEPYKWDFKAYSENCLQDYNIIPREMMAPLMYGGKHIKFASNIVFSNGDLDPWAGGGVLNSISDSLVAIYIRDGAHHLDLREANPLDTVWVTKARETEKFYIKRDLRAKFVKWITLVDHFSFANKDTYLQRYLINDTFWKPNSGPIFFYTGNEGDIEELCDNTGFMWDIASEFNALIVFAEHRYYGQSLPYGDLSYSNLKYLGYLTSEQALADFAQLITSLKDFTKGAANVPVIAFGGSYGGMLAAWMRIKYPHIIQGALAASAPILMTNVTYCQVFSSLVTRDFTSISPECSKSIRKSWDIINNFNETVSGKEFLTQTFRLCSPIETNDDLLNLKNWLVKTYTYLAMMNYPYPTDFMANLPGWPVEEVCKQLLNSSMEKEQLLKSLFAGVSIFFNSTGQSKCLNTTDMDIKDLGLEGWDFQTCTELIEPMCADGINDMFEPFSWDFEAFSDYCQKHFKVTPREMMMSLMYGGRNIQSASNIIFSNGDLDPVAAGGVLKNLSDSLVAIIIRDGAHHYDLRPVNPLDTDWVIEARETEKMRTNRINVT
uniref:Lysosomal Pro-X carboxypeptidase n=1 Tax=Strigamia maritima TaxID=126957 RepID=T1JCH1_STRMM